MGKYIEIKNKLYMQYLALQAPITMAAFAYYIHQVLQTTSQYCPYINCDAEVNTMQTETLHGRVMIIATVWDLGFAVC